MRLLFLGGCALIVALAAACTDMPSAPDRYDPVPLPAFSHWPTSAGCFSTQMTLSPHEQETAQFPLLTTQEEFDAAYAADLNGNGWVCLNLDEVSVSVYELPPPGQRTDFDDDHVVCPSGYAADFRGEEAGSVDENQNGFVCVSDSGDVQDDNTGGGTSDIPGEDPPPEEEPCPGIDTQIPVVTELHEQIDGNENGFICEGPFGTLSDDYGGAPPPPPPPPETISLTEGKVNGHGVYEVAGETLSFSFHARSDGESVKGNFEFHNRSTDVRIHGQVTCMEVDGGTALLEGIVTNDKEGGPGNGVAWAWTATDNGEGKKDPDDEVSAPEAFGYWVEACGVRPTEATSPISGGNIQVK